MDYYSYSKCNVGKIWKHPRVAKKQVTESRKNAVPFCPTPQELN